MKNSKKILSLSLAATMLAGSTTAFAMPTDTIILGDKAFEILALGADDNVELQAQIDAAIKGVPDAESMFYKLGNEGGFLSLSDDTPMTTAQQDALKNVVLTKVDGTQETYANFEDESGTVVEQADLTAYNAALNAVTEANYTAASWATYQAVVTANVVTVSNTQAEVDAAKDKIVAAQGSLVSNQTLAVASVKAINAKEIQVRFGADVDKDSAINTANYVIAINAVKYETKTAVDGILMTTPDNVSFDATTNTVTFKLKDNFAGAQDVLANGDKYSVDVRDGVLSKDKSKKVAKYTDTQKTFSDTTAPTLVKTEVTSANKLKLTFDEPVAAGLTATIDGVTVNLAAPSTAIKTYTVESVAVLADALKTVGNHAVSVYNATDLATPNANSATILTGSFTVSTDTVAPAIKEIRKVTGNDRAFDIVATEALKVIDASKLVVKKGNYTFERTAAGAANMGSTTYSVGYAALNADGTTGTLGAFVSGTTNVVRVTFGDDDVVNTVINPLYATGENSVSLAVEVDGYKDMVDLVGAKFNGTVTISKDLVAPVVTSQYDNSITGTLNAAVTSTDGLVVVKFDKALSTTASDTNKALITVTDKDGITRTVDTALVINDADDNKVSLKLTGLLDRDAIEAKAPYTVNFAANAVKATNNVVNSNLTTTVLASNNVASPVVEAVTSSAVASNVITVTYNTEMTATAATLANYTLDNVMFPAGTTISMDGTNKIVTITLAEGYTNTNISKLLTISKNVMTKSGSVVVGSVATKAAYTNMLAFTDNTQPTVTDAKFVVSNVTTDTQTSKIKVTFSENLANVANDAATKADIKVVVNGATQTVSTITDGTANDKVVTLTLANPVNVAQAATISLVAEGVANPVMNITDIATNKAKASTVVTSGKELDVQAAADALAVSADKAALTFTYDGTTETPLALSTTGTNGSTIAWAEKTDASTVGAIVGTNVTFTRSDADNTDETYVMTATVTKGAATDTKDVTVTVKEKKITVVTAATPSDATNDAAKLVVTLDEALYSDAVGTAITDGTDVKASFAYDGTAGNYTSATYNTDGSTHTVTFVIVGEDAKKLTVANDAFYDVAGNEYGADGTKTYTYANVGTLWTVD